MIGWLDCGSGASGDMLLGALLDAGVPLEVLSAAVDAVAPEPVRLQPERVSRAGFVATRAHVVVDDSTTHRTWRDVRALLHGARLDPAVRDRAIGTFARLADAEAAVHGGAPDEVHFHEVGALDAIADVVGVCAGLAHLGLGAVHASPVAVGGGRVQTVHGSLPVPPPAVVALLRGVPSYGGPVEAELCTPTGAALLAEWVEAFGPQPAMAVTTVGVGAGGRNPAGHPNVVRLIIGESTDTPVATLLLESNVDDLDPRLWPSVLAALLAAGASDAWLTPILMKKGRPAHTLSVLVGADHASAVRELIFRETSTIGLREQAVGKHALQRRETTVEVMGRTVRVKLAVLGDTVVNAQPEYEDVALAAAASGESVKSTLARAIAQARALW
ncbi:MAG TPA: nickel pincer cofactor biosynthesis protein LarC [Nocardioidaceae bacterium]|nr:nickel pincer cofactor biosynthesis protein LarC [Nocardioidaceae bacterium]